MMTAVGMVRAGLGLTILPGSAREIRAEPALRSRPIAAPRFRRPVSLIKKANRTLPAASELFLTALAQAFAALEPAP
ncbi:LysR substrate-binding domain-containing protein [Methylobacterium sp. ID0610]|uniref:LysR substrate-binding domain-containing protein n=1 Tax=Methylobacterium carpenticola TaxID=3344827 RepID=UPI0036B13316